MREEEGGNGAVLREERGAPALYFTPRIMYHAEQ